MKKNKYKWGLCLLLLIMIGMTVVLLKKFNLHAIEEVLQGADKLPLLAAVLLVFLHLTLGALTIQIILRALGQPNGYLKSIKYACVEMYYSAVTPSSTGGQPAQLYYMTKDGVSTSAATLTLLLVTVVYKIVLLLFGVVVMIFNSDFVFGISKAVTILFLLGILINIAVVVFCLMLMYSKGFLKGIVKKAVWFLAKVKLLRNPEQKLNRFMNTYNDYHAGARFIMEHYGITIKLTLLMILQRASLFSVAYCVFLALGGRRFSWFDFLAIQIVISMAVDSMPFPGGAGLAETLYGLIYRKVFMKWMVIPAMLLTRGISFYFYFIICAAVTFISHTILVIRERASKTQGKRQCRLKGRKLWSPRIKKHSGRLKQRKKINSLLSDKKSLVTERGKRIICYKKMNFEECSCK